ncbi:polyprenol monophosphomannose synthase [Actinoplanes sp. N902-109]|uniref:polyprenol monophosphomannose synthase n=1 Tax=Actinoplanes sp. (strain N902-109) TaxID=649831 RepID=UPI0003294205|nr:polyprenol monophosphomannose synthase [Actinoplanes sp. N902-109]AGL20833.1 dolichyl-phosphate beta-d-mannosyltransferase [Actinoplanes sp. N902-109]
MIPVRNDGSATTSSNSTGVPYRDLGHVVVVVPTYNEAQNVRRIIDRVRAAVPDVDVLVADDNSPDGTGRIADDLARDDARLHVLHRAGKNGLGAAYLAGFAWARQRGYDVVVEMDADGSHAPEELARLLGALRNADAVLGSRWISGGSVHNWPRRRLLLSRLGNLYVRLLLRMPWRDATGGYRAYRTTALNRVDLAGVASQGYCFQIDLVWRLHKAGARIVEVPITFTERERGESKMSQAIVREALWNVTRWAFLSGKRGS